MRLGNKEQLVEYYNKVLAGTHKANIERVRAGFVTDTCPATLLSILIHCMENIDIMDDTQTSNITHYINKLSYVR